MTMASLWALVPVTRHGMAVVASDNAALTCKFGHKQNASTTWSHHILGGQSLKRELSQRITEPTVRHTILGVVHRDLELF